MFKRLVVVISAAFLISACQQPETATAPPPPPPAAPKAFIVFFDVNSSNLSPQARSILNQAAAAQKTSGSVGVVATGHADRSGSDAYNMALSLRRANATKAALVREGVPAAAITVVGRGESQPLVQTADGVLEPQNRRVEVAIGQMAASPSDVTYCKEMAARYRRHLGGVQADGDAGLAMSQCDTGEAAAGIPVLEKLLTAAKIALPPR